MIEVLFVALGARGGLTTTSVSARVTDSSSSKANSPHNGGLFSNLFGNAPLAKVYPKG